MPRHRAGQVLLAPRSVGRKPTAGQDHAAARADTVDVSKMAHDQPVHPAIGNQSLGLRFEPDRHPAVEQRFVEPRHDRIAEHQPRAARIAQPVGDKAQHEARAETRCVDRSSGTQKPVGLAARNHHSPEQHQFRQGPPDTLEVLAEQPAIEFRRLERPHPACGSGQVLAVIGMLRIGAELHARVLL